MEARSATLSSKLRHAQVCVYVSRHTSIHMYIYIHTNIFTYVYIHMYIYIYTCIYMYRTTYAHMCKEKETERVCVARSEGLLLFCLIRVFVSLDVLNAYVLHSHKSKKT